MHDALLTGKVIARETKVQTAQQQQVATPDTKNAAGTARICPTAAEVQIGDRSRSAREAVSTVSKLDASSDVTPFRQRV